METRDEKMSNDMCSKIDVSSVKIEKIDFAIVSSSEELPSDTSSEVKVRRTLRSRSILSNDKSESDEDNDDNGNIQDEGWSNPVKNRARLAPFANKPGLKSSIGDLNKIEDFYSLFVTEEMFEEIAKYTNLYALKLLSQKKTSPLNEWYPTSANEIKRVFGLIIWMGLVKLPELHLYWSRDPVFVQIFPPSVMPRNRFELLLQTLYFAHEDNINVNDCFSRIRPIIDTLNENFKKCYDPPETLCINESVPVCDPITFSLKHHNQKMCKYNVKIYKLCFKSGYTYNFLIYCRKKSDIEKKIPSEFFVSLCKDIFGKGHTIYTDNWCTSVQLAQELIARNTHLVGRIRSNSREIPREVVSKKLKRGKMFAKEYKNGITLLKWKDKRDLLFVSTKHSTETVFVKKKGYYYDKPKLIFDYNKEKSSDISELMAPYYNSLEKNVKWYRKLAFELLLNISVANAWIIHNKVKHDPLIDPISIVEFKKQLAIHLSHCYDEDVKPNLPHCWDKNNDTQIQITATKIIPKHRHQMNKKIGKNKLKKRGRCTSCYKKNSKKFGSKFARHATKQVLTYCPHCPKKPFLCLDCFNVTHYDIPL